MTPSTSTHITLSPQRAPRNDEIDVFSVSHPGKVRKTNQDRFLLATINKHVNVVDSNLEEQERLPIGDERLAFLAMVADGVGGGTGGAEASAMTLETVMQYVNDSLLAFYGARTDEAEFTELLQAAAMRAHEAVKKRRQEQGILGTMATTLTLYFSIWPVYYLLQLGDSRYYLFRDGKLRQVTRDQTMAQDLVDEGVLTRAAAAKTPMANVLSSAIGGDATTPVVTRLQGSWNSVHLICSDGLTRHVTDERIAEILGSMTSSKQGGEQLLLEALDAGGTDNITIILGRPLAKDQV
ncbi:MAG TPA: PP2C family serine/threonine-protein phosphatase [Gemmatimonadaceae bacterium]|nr:PP2C family serine/threonine-protein phosphatase [Gemmatimonadaceae bacterium]